jgi:hypothetical protein
MNELNQRLCLILNYQYYEKKQFPQTKNFGGQKCFTLVNRLTPLPERVLKKPKSINRKGRNPEYSGYAKVAKS